MNKKKIIVDEKIVSKVGIVVGTLGLISSVVTAICLKKKIKKTEKQILEVASCHNSALMYQEEKNQEFDERIERNLEEIVSNMEHFTCFIEQM